MSRHLPVFPAPADKDDAAAPIGLLGALGLAIAFVALATVLVNLLLLPVVTV